MRPRDPSLVMRRGPPEGWESRWRGRHEISVPGADEEEDPCLPGCQPADMGSWEYAKGGQSAASGTISAGQWGWGGVRSDGRGGVAPARSYRTTMRRFYQRGRHQERRHRLASCGVILSGVHPGRWRLDARFLRSSSNMVPCGTLAGRDDAVWNTALDATVGEKTRGEQLKVSGTIIERRLARSDGRGGAGHVRSYRATMRRSDQRATRLEGRLWRDSGDVIL